MKIQQWNKAFAGLLGLFCLGGQAQAAPKPHAILWTCQTSALNPGSASWATNTLPPMTLRIYLGDDYDTLFLRSTGLYGAVSTRGSRTQGKMGQIDVVSQLVTKTYMERVPEAAHGQMRHELRVMIQNTPYGDFAVRLSPLQMLSQPAKIRIDNLSKSYWDGWYRCAVGDRKMEVPQLLR